MKVKVLQRVKKLEQKVDVGCEFWQSMTVQCFREIVKEQLEEKVAEKVLKVIKENEALVRDTTDKRRVSLFSVERRRRP